MNQDIKLHIAVDPETGEIIAASTSRPGLAVEFSRLGYSLSYKERSGEVVVHEASATVTVPVLGQAVDQ